MTAPLTPLHSTTTMTTTVPPIVPDIRIIPLSELHESPHNTRQHFDEHKLAELAASMATSGQLTPILARPSALPKKAGFEIAAGHRRRRAAERAGLPSLMVIVKDLDDRTFLEILTIENLQREDVHPLEEAQGYRNLLTIDGYDPKQIAERVGKSESYVYDRLKLLQLVPDAQELFLANRLTLGHAIILARVGADHQKKLIDNTDGGGGLWRRDVGHATLGLLSPDQEDGKFGGLLPVSVRELQQWIDTHVRFDTADESIPQLFPGTAATLAEAEVKREKVIPITRDYHVHPDAKDEDGSRTYGPTSWKRADGQTESDRGGREQLTTACDHSVVGLVVSGEGRGDTFRVCIDKKRCTIHWGDEIKARNQRERARESAGPSSAPKARKTEEGSWQREERIRKENAARAKARWEKGGDVVLRAIVPNVKKLSLTGDTPAVKYFIDTIGDGLYGIGDTGKKAAKLGVPRGSSAADLIQHLIMIALIDRGEPGMYGGSTNEKDLQEDLDALKIKVDVVKLLDAASPEPKAAPKTAANAVGKGVGKKAGAKAKASARS